MFSILSRHKIGDDFISRFEDSTRIKKNDKNPRNTLMDDLRKFNTFTITCKDKNFNTNKAILQARSHVFDRMLSNTNFKEATENCMEITDCEPEIVEKMIEFLETDNVKETNGYECELYKIAHKYEIESFMIYCKDLLKHTLTFENASERLKLAMMCCDESIKEFLISWIYPNFPHICKTHNIFTEFNDEEIVNIFRPPLT